jgi:hypothetical protein
MRVGEERLGVGLESLLGVESLPLPILATSVGCGMRVPESRVPESHVPTSCTCRIYLYIYTERERER